MAIVKDKYGAKTYETGIVEENGTGKTVEYSIVDNGTPTIMMHLAHRCYTADTFKGMKKILIELSVIDNFKIIVDEETKLQHS